MTQITILSEIKTMITNFTELKDNIKQIHTENKNVQVPWVASPAVHWEG